VTTNAAIAANQIQLPIVRCPVARELYGTTEWHLDEVQVVARVKARMAENEVATSARRGIRHLPLAQRLDDAQRAEVIAIAQARLAALLTRT